MYAASLSLPSATHPTRPCAPLATDRPRRSNRTQDVCRELARDSPSENTLPSSDRGGWSWRCDRSRRLWISCFHSIYKLDQLSRTECRAEIFVKPADVLQ